MHMDSSHQTGNNVTDDNNSKQQQVDDTIAKSQNHDEKQELKDDITLGDKDYDEKKEEKNYAKYFAITSERQTRFKTILNNMTSLNFKLSKSSQIEYEIDNKIFSIETIVNYSKPYKDEPTIWYLETIMPGKPNEFYKYWAQSKYRLQWDKQIASHETHQLFCDNKTGLYVVNSKTKAAVGGLISSRSFTDLIQHWIVDEKRGDMEIASKSIQFEEIFPQKKGFVTADNTLYAQRITLLDRSESSNIPKLMVSQVALEWCKIEYMFQTNIGGWLPTLIVETGISGGIIDSFSSCRLHLLQNVFGLNVQVKKIK